jgi:hypothetical protein
MALVLGQLIYTSFLNVGFKTLASALVSEDIQLVFLQQIAHRYWDAYDPPGSGYQAIYLHQLSHNETLFGWLYSDGVDDWDRDHVPYFVSYYLADGLQAGHLELIFDCLATGPLIAIDRRHDPHPLDNVFLPTTRHYQPARHGVKIPSRYRDYSYGLLRQESLINFFIPLEAPPKEQHRQLWEQKLTSITTQLTAPQTRPSWLPHIAPAPVSASASLVEELQRRRSPERVALLIGVSDYGTGFETLPGVDKDLATLKQVLENPTIGNFSSVETLLNPGPQAILEAIESLFLDHGPGNEIGLLYFSGHALRDRQGQIYLTSGTSRRGDQKSAVLSTIIPWDAVKEILQHSRTLQPVVILDCCLSEAFPTGNNPWTDRPVSNRALRSNNPSVILLSSAITPHPFAQKGADLSLYTFYLTEGLATGAADLKRDGKITIQELHEYAKRKVQAAAPALSPQILGSVQRQQTIIASTPVSDTEFRYRLEAERLIDSSGLSVIHRVVLDALRERLEMDPKRAIEIESEVFKPYQDYQTKLKEYALGLLDVLQEEYPISRATYQRLLDFQAILGLTQSDAAPIESQVFQEAQTINIAFANVAARSHKLRSPWQQGLQTPQERPHWFWATVSVMVVVMLAAIAFGAHQGQTPQRSQQSRLLPHLTLTFRADG